MRFRSDSFAETFQRRLSAARDSDAYKNYERARDAVVAMKSSASTAAPSAYWSEELLNIEYMLDASPLVIERLRHHCYHVTGVWPYHYRRHMATERRRHVEKLDALLEAGGRDVFVPESPLLGGFGFEVGGGMINLDTLKYLEALIALDRIGALAALRDGERPIVWEIGAGWGGFAYQLKSLFPHVTYVISDLPELFLFSGTYVATAFRDARLIFYGADVQGKADIPWREADFVLLPHTALDALTPPRLDLAVNIASFQEMTTGQVSVYAERARQLECRILYSLNRERSPYNPELAGVRRVLERSFTVDVVPVLSTSYIRAVETLPVRALRRAVRRVRALAPAMSPRPPEVADYEHLVARPNPIP